METNVRIAETTGGARGFNEAGRERLIECARLSSLGSSSGELLDHAAKAFETAIRMDPAALAPRFNLVRAGFHFGDAELRNRATELAEETLKRHGAGELTLSGDDDLLPYDFYPSHFHAQRACDLRLDVSGGDDSAIERLKTLIIASVCFYLARSMGTSPAAEAHYMAALKLDPEHTHFRIGYSEYLLGVRPQERRRVTDELKDIASNRIWTPLLAALTRRTSEGEEDCSANVVYLDVEDEAARDRRYRLARCHHMTGDKYFGTARLREGVPRLAFVLCGAGISASAQVGIALSRRGTVFPDLRFDVGMTSVLFCALRGDAAVICNRSLATIGFTEAQKQFVVDSVLRESLPERMALRRRRPTFFVAVEVAGKCIDDFERDLIRAVDHTQCVAVEDWCVHCREGARNASDRAFEKKCRISRVKTVEE